MKLFWNTNKNLNTFWGNYHSNNSREWIFYILKMVNIDEIDRIENISKDEKGSQNSTSRFPQIDKK